MAQQKKTEIFNLPELEDLTAQQMNFVKGLLDGKTGADAYRAAYNCENMKPETVWAAASRLRHDTKVAAWLTAARMANLGAGTLTLVQHMQELERLKEIAISTGNIGAAVQAEQLRGKATGHYTEKLEVSTGDPVMTLDDIARQFGDEVASAVAQQEGVAWETKH